MRIHSVLLLTVAVPFLVVACSSPPPPKPETATPSASTAASGSATPASSGGAAEVPRGEFAARMAKMICDGSGPCCSAAGAVHDQEHCVTQVLGQLGWTDQVADTKNYDAKRAARCLDEARTLATKCTAARKDVLRLASCAATFSGSKKTGEACEDDEECAPPSRGSAFCWQGAMADAPGRCAVSLPPEMGAACFTPLGEEDKKQLMFSECNDADAMRCDPATNTCAPRVKAGGACQQPYECEEGALCMGRKCKPMAGAACKSSNDCASKQACNGGKCGPGKKIGEPCASVADCADGMCAASTNRCGSWAAAFLCKGP